jgi:SBP domain
MGLLQLPALPIYAIHSSTLQVAGCSTSLEDAKPYNRNRKVCDHHMKASSVTVEGVLKRWCGLCSRFQDLSEFDGGRRTCRAGLQVCCWLDCRA